MTEGVVLQKYRRCVGSFRLVFVHSMVFLALEDPFGNFIYLIHSRGCLTERPAPLNSILFNLCQTGREGV